MNENQSMTPLGGEEFAPLVAVRKFDAALLENPSQAILDLMEKMKATPEEIMNVKRSFSLVGCKISQVDMPLIQIMFAQLMIEKFRDELMTSAHEQNVSIIKTAEQHRGEILRQSRDARSEALAHINAEIKTLSDEVLTNADHMFTKTRNQSIEVSQLIARLDPRGELVEQFAGSVLNGVSKGIQDQADTFNAGMNQALDEHIHRITLENSILKNQLAGISGEVKKIQDLKVQDLVSPLSQELTKQMSSVADNAKSVVEKLRAGMEANSKEAAEKLKSRNDETKQAFVEMTQKAIRKFDGVIAGAEEKFEGVIEKMEQAIEGKFWLERLKIWGGMAVIAVLASGLTNYLLFFRFFKY